MGKISAVSSAPRRVVTSGLVAPDPDRPLIIAEGIETGLAAAQLGGSIDDPLPAIATIGKDPDLVPPTCLEIIVASDNDKDDEGFKYAKKLATNLNAPGRIVRIAEPPVSYKDWNDVLTDAGVSELEELRHAITHGEKVKETREVRSMVAAEFMQVKFPPRPYLMRPWLKVSGLAIIHAQRGDGKTWLALSVWYAIGTGQSLLGWRVVKVVRVLYVDGELPGEEMQGERLAFFGELPSNLHILSRDYLERQGVSMPDLADAEGQAFLDDIIERDRIDVIFLNSISTLFRSGVENNAKSWAKFRTGC